VLRINNLFKGVDLLDVLLYVLIYTVVITVMFVVLYNLAVKFLPFILKYIKKGLSDREETRITGFRVLLKMRLNNIVTKILAVIYVVVLSLATVKYGMVDCIIKGSIFFAIGFLTYSIIVMVYDYITIRNQV